MFIEQTTHRIDNYRHPTTCVSTKNYVAIIEELNKTKLTYRINIKTNLPSKQLKKAVKNILSLGHGRPTIRLKAIFFIAHY